MFAELATIGRSMPESWIARSAVPNGVPVHQTTTACAPLPFMCATCAATDTSVTPKNWRSTISRLLSRVELSTSIRSPSCPLASVVVRIAIFFSPRFARYVKIASDMYSERGPVPKTNEPGGGWTDVVKQNVTGPFVTTIGVTALH